MTQISKKSLMAFSGGFLMLWCVLLVGAHSQSAESAPLAPGIRPRFADYQFDFSLVDDTIIPHQPIWLRIAQSNITDHEVPRLLMHPGAQALAVRLYNDSGMVVNVGMPSVYAISAWHGTLTPGETEVSYWDFGMNLWDFTPESVHVALEGRRLSLGVQFHKHVFADPSQVPPTIFLEFNVVAPSAAEAEAVRLISRAREESASRQDSQSRETCHELLDRYPQSKLVERAVRLLDFLGPGDNAHPTFRVDLAHQLARLKPGSLGLIRMARIIKEDLGVSAYDSLLVELRRQDPRARALEVLKEAK